MLSLRTTRTPRPRASGEDCHRYCIQNVAWPVGAGGVGRAHRATDHDGLWARADQIQKERGLLERVGAVRDHDRIDRSIVQAGKHPASQEQPIFIAQVLARQIEHLFGAQFCDARNPRDLADDLFDAQLAGRISRGTGGIGNSGNGAPGGQHPHVRCGVAGA